MNTQNIHHKNKAPTQPMRKLFANNIMGNKEDPLHNRIRLHNIRDKNAPPFKKFVNKMHAVNYHLFVNDDNFYLEFPCEDKFYPRLAELYFPATLRDRLGLLLIRPLNGGPDFLLNNPKCWFEVVTTSTGATGSTNAIPKLIPLKFISYSEDQLILRLTNAFSIKSTKIKNYIKNGIIDSSRPVVICVCGNAMGDSRPVYVKGRLPPIVKSLLPVNDALFANPKTNTFSAVPQYRPYVTKATPAGSVPVGTDFFLRNSHAHISAVIYFQETLSEQDKWGGDFITVHNPKAKNPLPHGLIKCGKEYLTSCMSGSFTIEEVSH